MNSKAREGIFSVTITFISSKEIKIEMIYVQHYNLFLFTNSNRRKLVNFESKNTKSTPETLDNPVHLSLHKFRLYLVVFSAAFQMLHYETCSLMKKQPRAQLSLSYCLNVA